MRRCLNLCEEFDAVVRTWNQMMPRMAVVDVVGVPCSKWSGTIRRVSWWKVLSVETDYLLTKFCVLCRSSVVAREELAVGSKNSRD